MEAYQLQGDCGFISVTPGTPQAGVGVAGLKFRGFNKVFTTLDQINDGTTVMAPTGLAHDRVFKAYLDHLPIGFDASSLRITSRT